jgi:hypothetical protein
MSGSSISCTLYPQIVPVMSSAFGFIAGACAKKVSRSRSSASAAFSPSESYPVSQQITVSTFSTGWPLRSAFAT